MAEGEVVKWLVKEGTEVKENQPLVEIMTDKVNVEIPSPKAGTVLRLMAKEGEVIKVGQVLIVIVEKGQPLPLSAPTVTSVTSTATPANKMSTPPSTADVAVEQSYTKSLQLLRPENWPEISESI